MQITSDIEKKLLNDKKAAKDAKEGHEAENAVNALALNAPSENVNAAHASKPSTSGSVPAFQIFQMKQRIRQVLGVLEQHKKKKLEEFNALSLPAHGSAQYKLPPMVFFVAHVNTSVFSLIIEQLPLLKNLGYTRICFEHDNDKTLEQTIAEFARSKDTFEREKRQYLTDDIDDEGRKFFEYGQIYQDLIIKPTLEFLQRVKKEESWLKYVGIDGPLSKYRTHDFAELLDMDPKIDEMREDCYALTTALEAEQSSGGVLVIAGYGHSKFQEKLEQYRSAALKHYQFFEFLPICEERFVGEDTERQIKATIFKYKPIPLDTTKGMEKMMAFFKERLLAQMSAMGGAYSASASVSTDSYSDALADEGKDAEKDKKKDFGLNGS